MSMIDVRAGPDSRLFDTGGFKSTKRDITEDQMLDELEQTLGCRATTASTCMA